MFLVTLAACEQVVVMLIKLSMLPPDERHVCRYRMKEAVFAVKLSGHNSRTYKLGAHTDWVYVYSTLGGILKVS